MNKRILTALAAILTTGGLAFGAASLASADDLTATATTESTAGPPRDLGSRNTDPSKPMRSDEQLLTGDTATKVTAAAKAEEPDATIERVETDSDGVYEAHMVRSDGTHITVQIDQDFTVTAVVEMGQGGPGGPLGTPSHSEDDSQSFDGSTSSTSTS